MFDASIIGLVGSLSQTQLSFGSNLGNRKEAPALRSHLFSGARRSSIDWNRRGHSFEAAAGHLQNSEKVIATNQAQTSDGLPRLASAFIGHALRENRLAQVSSEISKVSSSLARSVCSKAGKLVTIAAKVRRDKPRRPDLPGQK